MAIPKGPRGTSLRAWGTIEHPNHGSILCYTSWSHKLERKHRIGKEPSNFVWPLVNSSITQNSGVFSGRTQDHLTTTLMFGMGPWILEQREKKRGGKEGRREKERELNILMLSRSEGLIR